MKRPISLSLGRLNRPAACLGLRVICRGWGGGGGGGGGRVSYKSDGGGRQKF